MINRKLLLDKQVLNKLKTLNESEDDKYYRMSAEEYHDLLFFAGYNPRVTKLKKFQGKPLWIDGDVDLRRTPIKSLGNVAHIQGNLDISGTNIESLEGITVTRHIWDSNTPLRRKKDMQEIADKKEQMMSDRENKTREEENPVIDDEDLKAIALFKFLVANGDVNEPDDEDKETIKKLKAELEVLQKQYDESEDSEEYNKLYDRIFEIESELEDLEPKFDVYDIFKKRYSHYGMTTFELLDYDSRDKEYTVGTSEEMDDAAYDYAKSYLDDVGIDGFNNSFIENYLDDNAVREVFEEHYEDLVRDSPDSYFEPDDYQLTDEQELRIEKLQEYIEELENYISDKEDEQNDLNDQIEEPEDYRKAYEEIQKLIDEAQSKKDDAEEELDDIKPIQEPTEEMIEDKIQSLVDDDMESPIRSLKNHGLEIRNFIDEERFARGLVDSDGWGIMNSYDGRYDEVRVANEVFYVMRVN